MLVDREIVTHHREDRLGRRHLHLLGDAAGPGVQRTPEHTREREHIVDLVREVAAAGGHHGCILLRVVGMDLRVGIGQREHDRIGRHRRDELRGHDTGRQPEEHVRALQRLGHSARQAVRIGLLGDLRLVRVEVAAVLVQDALRVQQRDVANSLGQQYLCACDTRGAGTGDDHAQCGDVAVEHLRRTEQRRQHDDRGAVLVVVHDRAVQRLDEAAFDLEAARRRDVLEVHRTERRPQPHQGLDDLVGILGVQHDRDRVEVGERLEQRALALHHRKRRGRPDVAEAEDRAAVADHRDHPVGPGVPRRQRVVGGDRTADLSNARRVGDRQRALGVQRRVQCYGQLSAYVRSEDLVVMQDDRGPLV